MTDREIMLAWASTQPHAMLRVIREESLYLMADKTTALGAMVRCVRSSPLDASDEEILAAIKELSADVLIAEAQFPPHLAQLGRAAHGA